MKTHRPLLTTPPQLQRRDAVRLQRDVLATQPWVGLGGLVLSAVVFFALALGLGNTATSLLVLGPMTVFAVSGVAMIGFWWNDWPGSRLNKPWTGLTDTALIVVGGVVLTIAGEAIIERPDIRAVFLATPGNGAPTTFPATLALAGAIFTTMLQLSLVCERWPLNSFSPLKSGVAGLALSWAVGVGAYFLFVNVDFVPAAVRAAAGLHNPGGPVSALDFGIALIVVGVWQTVFFVVLRGWPVNLIGRRPLRLLAGNTLVIGGGAATYLVLRDLANLSPQAIGAACGCVISAGLMVALVFEGWPGALLRRPGAGRMVTLVFTAAVAVGLNRALAGYADSVHWVRAAANDWVTVAGLAFSAVGIILHVAIGRRWPLRRPWPTRTASSSRPAPALPVDRRAHGDHRRRRASSGDEAVETPVGGVDGQGTGITSAVVDNADLDTALRRIAPRPEHDRLSAAQLSWPGKRASAPRVPCSGPRSRKTRCTSSCACARLAP